jgi:hypothetical protein
LDIVRSGRINTETMFANAMVVRRAITAWDPDVIDFGDVLVVVRQPLGSLGGRIGLTLEAADLLAGIPGEVLTLELDRGPVQVVLPP